MTRNTQAIYLGCALLAAALVAGCASSPGERAPVIDHSTSATGHVVPVQAAAKKFAQREGDWRPQVYVVQKGDTLYSIALNFGFDYRELAELNGIQNPAVIHIGDELRLFPAGTAVVSVVKPAVVVDSKPADNIKSQPMVGKLFYSEQAVAQIEKMQEAPAKAEPQPVAVVSQQPKPEAVATDDTDASDAVNWGLPTNGKVIAGFSENNNRKGIDIAGKLGQPVFASAAGKVVYSGSGLRGYGKLIIIKHNSTYLSAYAHNDKVLMKEGQAVNKGQKIAEMGNTDADRVELHFEIRKLGKPVDPAKYLALPKS